MSDRKWTVEEIEQKIEWEGFDYFFTGYISPASIADDELRDKAREYRQVRKELKNILEEKVKE